MQDSQVYVRTYFRIDTPSYFNKGDLGFKGDEGRTSFIDEAVRVLESVGFERIKRQYERAGDCPSMQRGVESVYCHPQEISGYVAEEGITAIEEALQGATTFKWHRTDRYETMYNYTEQEFREALEAKRAELVSAILERFKTKRRNLYVYGCQVLYNISLGLPYIKHDANFTHSPLEGIENEFKGSVFDELVKAGDIITASKNGAPLYRSRSLRDPAKCGA